MAELVDALDLGSSGAIRGGSSPPFRILFDVSPLTWQSRCIVLSSAPGPRALRAGLVHAASHLISCEPNGMPRRGKLPSASSHLACRSWCAETGLQTSSKVRVGDDRFLAKRFLLTSRHESAAVFRSQLRQQQGVPKSGGLNLGRIISSAVIAVGMIILIAVTPLRQRGTHAHAAH